MCMHLSQKIAQTAFLFVRGFLVMQLLQFADPICSGVSDHGPLRHSFLLFLIRPYFTFLFRLLQIIPENTPLQRAFSVADDVLRQGVVGISEIIIRWALYLITSCTSHHPLSPRLHVWTAIDTRDVFTAPMEMPDNI